MKKFILLFIFISGVAFSQENVTGKKDIIVFENGSYKTKTVMNPLPNNGSEKNTAVENSINPLNPLSNTNIRWAYTEPAAIGDYCFTSGSGKYNVTGWGLNNFRISLYGNLNSNPIWEFSTSPLVYLNYVTISDTGSVIGAASYHNVYLFDSVSNVPFFNFDLTLLRDTGIASPLEVTKDGKFLVCGNSRQDSSTVFGFNSNSNIPVWSYKIIPSTSGADASIQGLKMSGNDSLIIVNTYQEFFIIKSFSGQLVYKGLINPGSPGNGTQAFQGISGDGSVIATINYSGYLRVYQWNGTTYNFLWQNYEPPGMFYNWYTTVDISYDGDYIAAGTLNFLTTSTFDGKVKVFKRSGSGVPLWTYSGCGDEVTAVSFSKKANILSASSWGEFNNTTEDLYIFKTFLGNVPIFKVNTPGSFFYCNTSGDGRTVVASGKAVNARQFGNGGLMYNIDVDTSDAPPVGINTNGNLIAGDYKLYQNYPNPFNPVTKINYELLKANYVSLKIYAVSGKEVATLVNEKQNEGEYSVIFNAGSLPSGVYFYKIQSGEFSDVKRMVLIK